MKKEMYLGPRVALTKGIYMGKKSGTIFMVRNVKMYEDLWTEPMAIVTYEVESGVYDKTLIRSTRKFAENVVRIGSL